MYASADAARVGGGLYQHLLHAAVTLATDPAPMVAAVGTAILRVAGVQLAEALRLPGAPHLCPHPRSVLYGNCPVETFLQRGAWLGNHVRGAPQQLVK